MTDVTVRYKDDSTYAQEISTGKHVIMCDEPGQSNEQRERLLETAGRCPVHRTLASGPTLIDRLAQAPSKSVQIRLC
jgi:uncharacterized OsmC-like protein